MNTDKVIDFKQAKLINTQAAPSDPSGPDWLGKMSVGTIFLTRQKNAKSFELVSCEILGKTKKSARIKNSGMEDADGKEVSVKVTVDTAMFSSMMDLVEVVAVNAGPDKEEQNNGNGDQQS